MKRDEIVSSLTDVFKNIGDTMQEQGYVSEIKQFPIKETDEDVHAVYIIDDKVTENVPDQKGRKLELLATGYISLSTNKPTVLIRLMDSNKMNPHRMISDIILQRAYSGAEEISSLLQKALEADSLDHLLNKREFSPEYLEILEGLNDEEHNFLAI